MEINSKLETYMEGDKILSDGRIDKKFNDTIGDIIRTKLGSVKLTVDKIKGTQFVARLNEIYTEIVHRSVMNSINDKGVIPQQQEFIEILNKAVKLALTQFEVIDDKGILDGDKLNKLITNELALAKKPLNENLKPTRIDGD